MKNTNKCMINCNGDFFCGYHMDPYGCFFKKNNTYIFCVSYNQKNGYCEDEKAREDLIFKLKEKTK